MLWIGILHHEPFKNLALLLIAAICALSAGCAIVQDIQNRQATAREERERAELRQTGPRRACGLQVAGRLEEATYRNKALLSQATAENVSLEISLGEQRGLLLVRTAIAMDFPVATGKKSHPTPSGNLHHPRPRKRTILPTSTAKIYDAQNVVLVGDADARTDARARRGTF